MQDAYLSTRPRRQAIDKGAGAPSGAEPCGPGLS